MNYFLTFFAFLCIWFSLSGAQTCQPSQGCSVEISFRNATVSNTDMCPLPSGFVMSAINATLGALPANCSIMRPNTFEVQCKDRALRTGGTGGRGTKTRSGNSKVKVLLFCNSCNAGTLDIPSRGRGRGKSRGTGTGNAASACQFNFPTPMTITVSGMSFIANIRERGVYGYFCGSQLIPRGTVGASCTCPAGCQ